MLLYLKIESVLQPFGLHSLALHMNAVYMEAKGVLLHYTFIEVIEH